MNLNTGRPARGHSGGSGSRSFRSGRQGGHQLLYLQKGEVNYTFSLKLFMLCERSHALPLPFPGSKPVCPNLEIGTINVLLMAQPAVDDDEGGWCWLGAAGVTA